MTGVSKKSDGRFILACFIAFFALIILVNSVFIYSALKTHSGVVIKQPYEKGLAFNETLAQAKKQANIQHKVSYKNGILHWSLPVQNAAVTATIIRPIKDGYDYNLTLRHHGNGVYKAKPKAPLPGAWTAHLKATWNNQTLQTSHSFITQ